MRLDYRRHVPWVLAGLLLGGCKGDDPPPQDGDGGSSSTGEDMGSTSRASTGMDSADSTAGEEGGSSSEGGSSTGLPTEVAIRGTIQDFFLMQPIVDAEITVLGQPGLATTSDAAGDWELLGVPVNTFDRFVVTDTKEYWGAVLPFRTEYEDIEEFELSQVSLDVIDIQITELQQQDPTVMVEPDTAVLLIALEQNTATGAVVELDPPPDANTFYAPNADGQPILGTSEIQWGFYPVAVFFNLAPGEEGDYTITVTHPDRECTPDDPQPPTFGRYINLIRVDCPPPN